MPKLRDLLLMASAASELEDAVRQGKEEWIDFYILTTVRRKIYMDLVEELLRVYKGAR